MLASRSVRLASRRWRLWWRYQLRVLPWRRPFRRLRWPRTHHGELPESTFVLKTGRLVGRAYLSLENARERLRIGRARIPDQIEPARNAAALVSLQRGLVVWLAILVAAGLGADEGVRLAWGPVASHLGVDHWVRANLSKPSPETLRNLLAASAGGTATILGLVLSISLITWQTTAERYRSSSIVAFLLRERMGSAVVRLLALAFAYSLWLLALLEVFRFRPYGSTVFALVLSTLAVLSLLSYRQYGLLGSLPRSLARGLKDEMIREFGRAQRPHAGRSVENYSRQVVAADVQIFRDLLRRLMADEDIADVAACLAELTAASAVYVQAKRRFPPTSLFFAQRKERLGAAGYAIEEAVASQGLMDPTTTTPDHLWFEKAVLAAVDEVATPALLANPDVAERVIRLWGTAVQLAWYGEDPDVVELILGRIDAAAVRPEFRAEPGIAEEFSTLPWVMAELAGAGFTTTSASIVARRPWEGEKRLRNLPWKAQEDGRALASQIETEIFVTGAVVSPAEQQVQEVEAKRGPRLSEARDQLLERAIALCALQLRLAVAEQSASASVIARMSIRTLLRVVHHGLDLPQLGDMADSMRQPLVSASREHLEEVLAAAGRAARVLAERQAWSAAYDMLRVCEDAGLLIRLTSSDSQETIRPFFDGLITAAIVFGWGEYHQRGDHVRETGRYVQPPYANLDALIEASGQHQLGGLFPNVVHFQWAKPLTIAVGDLPERAVFDDGAIGYDLETEHASPLFARSSVLGIGPNDLLDALVEAAAAERLQARQGFLDTLAELIEARRLGGP